MKLQAQFRLRITADGDIAIGPGKIALLEAILAAGSISAGAKLLNMSYRRAWQLVDAMNTMMAQPVVETAVGGSSGGGTVVTETGHRVIALYRRIEAQAQQASAQELKEMMKLIRK